VAQLSTEPSIQHRRIVLNPAPYRRVVHGQAALGHHFFKITVAQRVSQIPSHAQQDDLVFEVSPTEQSRPILSHSSHPIRTASRRLQQIPSK